MKQTSIEWLVDQLKKYDLSRDNILIVIPVSIWKEKVEQAKEMEKEQIIYAYEDGMLNTEMNGTFTGEIYYNENYK
jgi:hypothetical protein